MFTVASTTLLQRLLCLLILGGLFLLLLSSRLGRGGLLSFGLFSGRLLSFGLLNLSLLSLSLGLLSLSFGFLSLDLGLFRLVLFSGRLEVGVDLLRLFELFLELAGVCSTRSEINHAERQSGTHCQRWQIGWQGSRQMAGILRSRRPPSRPRIAPIRCWAGDACRRRLLGRLRDWTSMGGQVWRTGVVGADLERLVTSHHEADLLGRLVRQQADVPGSPLLPLGRSRLEAEQLGSPARAPSRQPSLVAPPAGHSHLEQNLLVLLHCFRVDLLRELYHRLKVGISLLVLSLREKVSDDGLITRQNTYSGGDSISGLHRGCWDIM